MSLPAEQRKASSLFLAILFLLGIGLVQVYSSSFIFATESFGDGLFFFKRQLFYVALSISILFFIQNLEIETIKKWGWCAWCLAGLGVLLTLVPGIGVKAGGASRWLQLPMGLRFEPSEILKFSFPFFFAAIITREKNILSKCKWPWLVAIVLVPLLLLLRQPDFGSLAIISFVGLGLLFALGLRWKYIFASLAVVLPTFYLLVMRVPYRRARVLAFLDPWADPAQKGFQVIQSMLSFHSGGFSGAGLGRGQGKLFFLPEAHTDFTLAVFGEEWGFIGFLVVLALYGFIFFRGFQIAVKCEDRFFKFLALGISMTFALSVFINSGVVMGLLPTKGLTLPFLSYGGSSLVTISLALGVLLAIEKHLKAQSQNFLVR